MYLLNMSTNVERREREQDRERERWRRISKVQRKRQRLANTSRKERVFCHFNRLGAPLGSGDSTFFAFFVCSWADGLIPKNPKI